MNDVSVAAHGLNGDPHVHGDHSAPHRRGGAWRRHMAIAAAGLAIVASAAGISDHAAAAGHDNLARTEGNGQPSDGITVTSTFIPGVNQTHDPQPNDHLSRDLRSRPYVGYVKKAELGKLTAEIAG